MLRMWRPQWALLWAVCGVCVRSPHTRAESISTSLLWNSSASPTEEPQKLPDPATPPSPNHTGLGCLPVLPPRRGSYYVERGTGVSAGTVLVFWCREGYQLVGSEQIHCSMEMGVPRWSNYLPVCETIPLPGDHGLRVALLVSGLSGGVILTMSASFISCWVQERRRRRRRSRRPGRSRRREKRLVVRRGLSWAEREDVPPPKLFSLSQRIDQPPLPPLARGSPLRPDLIGGYENRGYSRSEESLFRNSMTGLFHTDGQLYPHLLLQGVPPAPPAVTPPNTNTTPVYLHHPAATANTNTPRRPPLTLP